MFIDIVAIAAHPDDAELSCGGTLLAAKAQGKATAIIDLTRGELGTRGTPAIRQAEAEEAAKVLQLDTRLNLNLPDGHLQNSPEQRLAVVKAIRALKPRVVLCNAITDRHPDHGTAADLVEDACFLAGLKNIITEIDGTQQEWHRPQIVLHYIQDRFLKPDLVIDITPYMDARMRAVKAFKSQFFDPESNEPATYISSPEFFESVTSRSREMGRMIGVRYGEGYTCRRPIGLGTLDQLL